MKELVNKKGYKQTKIGWIPKEWWIGNIQQLVDENIISKPKDGNHGNIHPKGKDFVADGIPFIMANHIKNERLDLLRCNFISKKQADSLQKGFSNKGDILLTHKGSVGNTAIVQKSRFPYIMLSPQVTYYRVIDFKKLSSIFLRFFFQSKNFQNILEKLSGGGTRAYIGISAQRKLPIYLPPLPEQKKIAQILTTWDTAIDKTEQLLQRLQLRKQGLMQQLLSGKKRLRGFEGEWKEVKLGDVGETKIGLTYSPKDVVDKGGILVLRSSNIQKGSLKFDNNVFVDCKISEKNIVEEGDLLICARNGSRNLIGKNTIITKNVAGMAFGAFMSVYKSEFNNYFQHLFTTDFYYSQVYMNLGATINQITSKNIKAFKFKIPPKKEQFAITSILDQADTEIQKTETYLSQLREQKKGLMQVLLTGQKRVKV